MTARDSAGSLLALSPYDYFPWATDVPGRGWMDTERFKRHATLGHARSSIKNSRTDNGIIFKWNQGMERWEKWE